MNYCINRSALVQFGGALVGGWGVFSFFRTRRKMNKIKADERAYAEQLYDAWNRQYSAELKKWDSAILVSFVYKLFRNSCALCQSCERSVGAPMQA
eukprot:14867-Heterococcus_DN1.PRE.3